MCVIEVEKEFKKSVDSVIYTKMLFTALIRNKAQTFIFGRKSNITISLDMPIKLL